MVPVPFGGALSFGNAEYPASSWCLQVRAGMSVVSKAQGSYKPPDLFVGYMTKDIADTAHGLNQARLTAGLGLGA